MSECAKTPVDLVRLWMHEADRVYRDKLVDVPDMETFDKLRQDIIKKSFEVHLSYTFLCFFLFAESYQTAKLCF